MMLDSLEPLRGRVVHRGQKTGTWLTAYPSELNATILSKEEYKDSLCLRYILGVNFWPKTCDGCYKTNSISHSLACKTGGLVTARHNEVRDEIGHLMRLSSPSVWYEPRIKHLDIFVEENHSQQEDKKDKQVLSVNSTKTY